MLNRLMFQMLGSPAAVVFFYNQRGSSIGLLPANPQLDDAFPVINRASAWFINAAPFCRNYGLAPRTGTQAFLEPEIDNDGMLRLDTSKTIKVSHGPRKRRTKLEILTESCA